MPPRKKASLSGMAAKLAVKALPPARLMPDVAALTAVLQAHALGEHEMTPSQVTVALSLLKIFTGKGEETTGGLSHEDAIAALR